ncbi:hypothetical protein HPP92_015868 [Vanilla planifolia]|uniref:Uncharacterized protein n=1 Tax=Vanilla planifolia TaxID=51239 RepID=A0A835URI4_VANPL|nr:hypothetical protein HPP92_015868 [Vanilla planifolia]
MPADQIFLIVDLRPSDGGANGGDRTKPWWSSEAVDWAGLMKKFTQLAKQLFNKQTGLCQTAPGD